MDTIIAFWIFLLKQILKKSYKNACILFIQRYILSYVVTFMSALFLCGFELVSSVLTVHHEVLF